MFTLHKSEKTMAEVKEMIAWGYCNEKTYSAVRTYLSFYVDHLTSCQIAHLKHYAHTLYAE